MGKSSTGYGRGGRGRAASPARRAALLQGEPSPLAKVLGGGVGQANVRGQSPLRPAGPRAHRRQGRVVGPPATAGRPTDPPRRVGRCRSRSRCGRRPPRAQGPPAQRPIALRVGPAVGAAAPAEAPGAPAAAASEVALGATAGQTSRQQGPQGGPLGGAACSSGPSRPTPEGRRRCPLTLNELKQRQKHTHGGNGVQAQVPHSSGYQHGEGS